MSKILTISQDDQITDHKLCGEYTPKPGMSMVQRCADFFFLMRTRLPYKYIASNIVYMFITGDPMPAVDSEEVKKTRSYTSSAHKYSKHKYGCTVITARGFGARMSVDDLDKQANRKSEDSRMYSAIQASKETDGIVDVSKIPTSAMTAPLIAEFQKVHALVTNPAVLKCLEALKYTAPKQAKAEKK